MPDSVRFARVVEIGGKPSVYLPLVDPRSDKTFTRAEKEHRIVSLKQTPTGTKKDFGVVGALRENFVTYLIFPKSLRKLAGKRVVGIKYDQIESAETSAPAKRKSPAKSPLKSKRQHETVAIAKRESEMKKFQARVRVEWKKTLIIEINALNRSDATAKAKSAAKDGIQPTGGNISIHVLAIKHVAERSRKN